MKQEQPPLDVVGVILVGTLGILVYVALCFICGENPLNWLLK